LSRSRGCTRRRESVRGEACRAARAPRAGLRARSSRGR
jgi:hypothetical protein